MVAWSRVRWREVPAVLWSARGWVAIAHLVTGGLLWLAAAGLVVGVAALGAATPTYWQVGGSTKTTRIVDGLAALVLAALALVPLTPAFTRWQRSRFRRFLGVRLASFDERPAGQRRWRWMARQAVARRTWRQVRYHALVGPLALATGTAAVAGVLAGAGIVVMAFTSTKLDATSRTPVACLGILLVLVTLWLARGCAALDAACARALLQPPPEQLLARRVASLSASRAAAIEAADAERRRIERDLHDGTQQRLVSLAMNLGMTRSALREADPAVRDAVAQAHEEAKLALAELRGFIRGLHPAILDEQGLDASLSGIAARSPVPVRLAVDLPVRPGPAVEAVAYFVVSEALANAARHAAASRVHVDVRGRPGVLAVEVTDDGRGGADPERGTGLRGLRQRVESVDGVLRVTSPAGGPTSIMVMLPCG